MTFQILSKFDNSEYFHSNFFEGVPASVVDESTTDIEFAYLGLMMCNLIPWLIHGFYDVL